MDTKLRYDPQQCRVVDEVGETVMEAPSRLYVLHTDPEGVNIRERLDALGLKMAAAPELVEAVRRALWHVTGDCDAWIRSAVKEFETETGRSARDAVGYTNEFHSWCQAREARDAAFLRDALKKAGVEP